MSGGYNISPSGFGNWPKLNYEYILYSRPKIIILLAISHDFKLIDELMYWYCMFNFSNEYVIVYIDSDLLVRSGPRITLGSKYLLNSILKVNS